MAHPSVPLLDASDGGDPSDRELASSPSELAEQVENSLKRVVQETAWTIKRRQQAIAIGFDITKEAGELHKVQQTCLQYVHSVGALRTWLMHAQAALMDELKTATEREAKEAQEAQERAAKEAAEKPKAEEVRPSADAAAAQASEGHGDDKPAQGDVPMVDLTGDDSPKLESAAAAPADAPDAGPSSDAAVASVSADASSSAPASTAASLPAVTPSVDATAIIQQIINNMPSSSQSVPTSDFTSFDLGEIGLGSSSSAFDGSLDLQSFDFDGMDFGGGSSGADTGVNGMTGGAEGGFGDLSSLDFTTLGAQPNSNSTDFDLTSMIQSFDQATSSEQ